MKIMNQGDLTKKLEQAVNNLEMQGRGETAAAIMPVVFENLERGRSPGRVQKFLRNNPAARPCDYVDCVANTYESLNRYLYQIQEEKDDCVWKPLFVKMQRWAYNYFLLKNFSAGQRTFLLAHGCATNAGGDLVHAYFPYDTDFDAWACTIVRNHCKKAIARLMRAGHLPDHKLVSLTDLSPNQVRTADLGGDRLAEWRLTLVQLIEQLSSEEQETILLYFFEGLTLFEIGQHLGISTTTAHRRYYSAIDFLRKNLT